MCAFNSVSCFQSASKGGASNTATWRKQVFFHSYKLLHYHWRSRTLLTTYSYSWWMRGWKSFVSWAWRSTKMKCSVACKEEQLLGYCSSDLGSSPTSCCSVIELAIWSQQQATEEKLCVFGKVMLQYANNRLKPGVNAYVWRSFHIAKTAYGDFNASESCVTFWLILLPKSQVSGLAQKYSNQCICLLKLN